MPKQKKTKGAHENLQQFDSNKKRKRKNHFEEIEDDIFHQEITNQFQKFVEIIKNFEQLKYDLDSEIWILKKRKSNFGNKKF